MFPDIVMFYSQYTTHMPVSLSMISSHTDGLPAIMEGRSGRYNIDFCLHPEAICGDFEIPASEFNKFPTTINTSEAKYFIGLAYWVDYVQNFNWGYWNYSERLKLFLDGGMVDDTFVDEFSEIVIDSSRDGEARKANFKKALEVLFQDVITAAPTSRPTRMPVSPPTPRPTVKWNIDGTISTGQTSNGDNTDSSGGAPPATDSSSGTSPGYNEIIIGPIGSSSQWINTDTSDGDVNIQPPVEPPLFPGQPAPGSMGKNPSAWGPQPGFGSSIYTPPPTPKLVPVNKPGPISIDLSIPLGGDGFPSNFIVGGDEMTTEKSNTAAYIGCDGFLVILTVVTSCIIIC